MELGTDAQPAIDVIVDSTPNINYRQLRAVDMHGNGAVYSGEHVAEYTRFRS